MEVALENTKDELFKLKEKVKKDFEQHKEDTDQVIMKLMEKMGEKYPSKVEDTLQPEVKQQTIVNILVRIELLENEIRTLKNI